MLCEWCAVRGWWRWLRTGFGTGVSGHAFSHQETHRNCTVVVSVCACGQTSISWHHGDPNAVEQHPVMRCACVQAVTGHRCCGCGHRWTEDLEGGTLCGDCWRKAQGVVLARDES